uniref:Sorting nexin-14-like n=1 Tax=Sinocyclocheilus grahami TaxID=75366 RepID=A0A672JYM3_SINGR
MSDPHSILACVRRGLRLHVFKDVARQYPVIFCIFTFMISSTIILNQYLHILLIFWLFLAGVITFYCSLSPEYLLPNVLISIKTERKPQKQQELFPLGHSCAVCGKNQCKRHRPTLLLENYQPWLDLKVPSKVDASISEVDKLINQTNKSFAKVTLIPCFSWKNVNITGDEACVDELRQTIHFFAAVLAHRAQRVDVPLVLMDKMMKAAMKHIEIIAKAQQKVKNTEGLQQAALAEYGSDLHVALRSRKDELLYLRKLTELLFPYVMPPKATDCRSLALLIREVMTGSVFLPIMDFVADPDTVNHMVLIFIDDTPPEPVTDPPSALVPFLEKFADPRNTKSSVLKLDLKEIREQQDLLFRFMSFLKEEGAVHVLQFCLTVEEFNDRILCPDLSDTEMQRLHEEVQKIYEMYCLEESIDKISFDPFIIEEIHNIAQGPSTGVVKLQTMPCLFEAYEHVLSLLENVFTPMFCHSDEYFRHLLWGAESPARNSKLNRNTSKRGESFGISRIGSKIKGVFKSSTMEGALLPQYAMIEGEEDTVEEAVMVFEDDSPGPVEVVGTPGTLRNLAAWTISIPYVDFFDDEVKKERTPVYCIDVERHDRKNVGHETESWFVYRKYLEFYVLESKLTEFHGLFQDIFKSVPGKLIKEKGQNLEPFIQSFFSSCESPKPKPSRPELTILSPTAENNKKLFNELYRNNANLPEGLERKHNQNYFMELMEVDGVYDFMMYIGRVVFHMPDWLHHFLSGARILLKRTLEVYVGHYFQVKLEQLMQEHCLVSLITLFRDAVFCESTEERSLEDKQRRAKQTFEEMMNYLPGLVGKCIGEEAKYEGVKMLFNTIQQPLLNKQMTYVLLDIAVQELFPELSENQKAGLSVSTKWM